MAKTVSLLLVIILLSFSSVSLAQEDIKVLVNGNAVTFDVSPQTINNRIMVPFRAIFESIGAKVRFIAESLGMKVSWNPDKMTVSVTSTIEEKKVGVVINGGNSRRHSFTPNSPVVVTPASASTLTQGAITIEEEQPGTRGESKDGLQVKEGTFDRIESYQDAKFSTGCSLIYMVDNQGTTVRFIVINTDLPSGLDKGEKIRIKCIDGPCGVTDKVVLSIEKINI